MAHRNSGHAHPKNLTRRHRANLMEAPVVLVNSALEASRGAEMAVARVAVTAKNVIPRHRDNLMGLPVVLVNSAFEASHGEQVGIVVPDIKRLESAMAVARVMVPAKLGGREIKFLRKALGMRSFELARFLDVTAEHFSRWVAGTVAISTNAERILRLRVLHALRSSAPGVLAKDDDILEMTLVPARSPAGPITLVFERLIAFANGESQQVWCFKGVENEKHPGLKVVA